MKRMNFKSLNDLMQSITDTIPDIRSTGPYDYIVGVPRSGVTPAANIAIMLGVPYADLTSFVRGAANGHQTTLPILPDSRVLLVDDTSSQGGAMKEAYQTLMTAHPTMEVTRYVVWSAPDTDPAHYDICSGVVPKPRMFEWNMWKIERLNTVAFDMDGVFCRDPNQHENDKGPKLIEYYKTAPAKFLPSKPVAYIITNRLERNREYTEQWLIDHGIQWGKLLMKENENEGHIDHKVRKVQMVSGNISMYVESDDRQARMIADRVSGLPVWCVDSRVLYNA